MAKDDELRIPVVQESVQVGKQVVEKGSIRFHKVIDEETVEVPLSSRVMGYSTERVAVNQYVSDMPPSIRYEGETMIFSVVEEEFVVEKRLKLVAEIRVTPTETESHDNVHVKLKKERFVIRRDGEDEQLKDKQDKQN